MRSSVDATHDVHASSWVESANHAGADFPIQNLPFGVFCRNGQDQSSIGIAIGDRVLDLRACIERRTLLPADSATIKACRSNSLNDLMALPSDQRAQLRHQLFRLMHTSAKPEVRQAVGESLYPIAAVEMQLPARIGDYTDFYASIFHATNVGSIFRPGAPLLPNYKWIPIGYHGRASSVVVSGAEIRRPRGQTVAEGTSVPAYVPSRNLDYELEIGMYIAGGNELGKPIPIETAAANIFGLCLVNDWSARDIQRWEYQPLGPFLAKSFATTVSPWIVTMEALAPYRQASFSRPSGDPAPLPYLSGESDRRYGAIDITLEVALSTAKMREAKLPQHHLSLGSFRDMYWTLGQLVAHHTSNGCNLRPGDLLASGTVSGSAPGSAGCLLELTRNGSIEIELLTGEKRGFLETGDEVILRGWCEGPGKARIGFGECRGRILN